MGLLDIAGKALGIGADTLTGGLFSLGTSLLNGISTSNAQKSANATNIELARMNNQAQIDLMRENNEFNKQAAIDMFNMQNEYNDPSKQVERLRKAGINPAAVLGGQGTTIANTGSASTPSSVGVPSLHTPIVNPVTPVSAQALETLTQLSQIGLNRSSAKNQDASADRTNQLVQAELAKYLADAHNSEANAAYQEIQNNLQKLFGVDERLANLKELNGRYYVHMKQGDYFTAAKEFQQMEKKLTSSQNELVEQQTPIILDNMKKQGKAILAQAHASEAQAKASEAAAHASEAQAQMSKESAETIRQNRPNIISLTKQQAKEEEARAKVADSTVMQQIEHWKNTVKLDVKQQKQLDEAIRKAKKENDWYEVDKIIGILQTISDEALGWASFGVSKLGRQTVTNHYNGDGDLLGTTSVNSYLYR